MCSHKWVERRRSGDPVEGGRVREARLNPATSILARRLWSSTKGAGRPPRSGINSGIVFIV